MADATFARGRLRVDLKELKKQAIEVCLVNNNIFQWEVVIDGPSDTIYDGFTYTVRLNFPDDYPFKPPNIQFNPPIEHPNVAEDGVLFISNLCPFGGDCCPLPNAQNWSPAWTAEKIVVRIIDVLKNPEFCKMMNEDVAVLFHKEPDVNNSNKSIMKTGTPEEKPAGAKDNKRHNDWF